ncbi:MAG TPA: DUF6686 family protein [Bacteroidia bacterium]|jgi:hypothetical protein|nr:DUF6686 family protein [Bacteroidia bacterium]
MNSHKLLSHTESGYIIRCNDCKKYRLAFGTTLVNLSANELKAFQEEVSDQILFFPHDGFYHQKIIHVPLPTSNSCLILNYTELLKLADMCTEVNLLEEVEHILLGIN